MGPANPLTDLVGTTANAVRERKFDPSIPEQDRRHIGYGEYRGCLPYFVQDDYGRQRRPGRYATAVLESDRLKATFLLGYGARLWSLFHKPSDRELLYVNPVFQPANFALRNAWFSGGVEWNFGVQGHSAFTCSPIFAARARLADGTPVLRTYEFERIRAMPYQMDFFAPDGSDVLFARGRLVNRRPWTVPVYWWSNIAVPETDRTRVLAPATCCYKFLRGKGMTRQPYPVRAGTDYSYPVHSPLSGDTFFHISNDRIPWEANVDAEGQGLFHASTRRLKGRKLFHFGTGSGGRRWQDFLSEPQHPYFEMQAGLARTQHECVPVAAGSQWEWLEAYGPVSAHPVKVHGADWQAAVDEVESRIRATVELDRLGDVEAATRNMAALPPEMILQTGSGWGALELRRQAEAGETPIATAATPFPESTLGSEQMPWLALLETHAMPETPPDQPPASWMTQWEWRRLLVDSMEHGRSSHWTGWLHLGMMHIGCGDFRAAKAALRSSADRMPTVWALRSLGCLLLHERHAAQAADCYMQALELCPHHPQLLVEYARAALMAGRPKALRARIAGLPAVLRSSGRMLLYEAMAALETGDLETVRKTLESPLEVTDMREGEISITNLWFRYHAVRVARLEGRDIDDDFMRRIKSEHPPPQRLDFRMKGSLERNH